MRLTRLIHPDLDVAIKPGRRLPVRFTEYGDESDPGPYPVPPNAPIEGQRADGGAFGGDRHVLVIDRSANRLYELGNAVPQADGSWLASGGAVFHLDSNTVRPGGRAIFLGLHEDEASLPGNTIVRSEIAVQGFRRVDEKGRSAGAGEGRRQLFADMTGFPDTGDNQFALAVDDGLRRADEVIAQAFRQAARLL